MDVFDMDLTFQREILNMVPSSPLLLNVLCALAARQLSLIESSSFWSPIAERYYSQGTGLLARLLDRCTETMELAIVSTMLLGSYELLAFPGPDYQRHVRGAKTIVDALHVSKSTNSLARSAFWIYARHEVGEAINMSSPTRHDPKLWPRLDPSVSVSRQDSYCNDILRICGEVTCFFFGSSGSKRTKSRAKQNFALHTDLDRWFEACPSHWMGVKYKDAESFRYWFPWPNFGISLKDPTHCPRAY